MRPVSRVVNASMIGAGLSVLLFSATARGQDAATTGAVAKPAAETQQPAVDNLEKIDLLDGLRTGALAVEGEGIGDGRMSLSIQNKTDRKLRVVFSPSLIASGASGQFGGGMGGMGGGMGGMGMGGMGGGMGGMGGGMGGMGGGMGGMGGGMGGMGGGMGGMSGGTMPPMMGMMMLGQLIMNLVGDKDSWDMTSMMSGMMGGMGGMGGGMMGGMGGMGMGGMGGGMGGMGGGMMGGMGGGFRSVPPVGTPSALLQPGQVRHLPTRVVSLDGPTDDLRAARPGKGEKLQIGDIREANAHPMLQEALAVLAREKAPEAVSQLVLWNLAGMDWATIGKVSRRWANANEMALARAFVARLYREQGNLKEGEPGVLYLDVTTNQNDREALVKELRDGLKKSVVLGLSVVPGIPSKPTGPGLACRVSLVAGNEAIVQVSTTDATAKRWVSAGKFTLPITEDAKPAAIADAMAEGTLSRLVHTQLVAGPKVKGKPTYKIRIDNVSPLILNGLALSGTNASSESLPSALGGLSLPPRKSVSLPASGAMVERLGLKDGVRAVAADLSGL